MNKIIGTSIKIFVVLLVFGALFVATTVIAEDSVPQSKADSSIELFLPLGTCTGACGWCPTKRCTYAQQCC